MRPVTASRSRHNEGLHFGGAGPDLAGLEVFG